MNLRFLRTLVAVSQHPSFLSAAADLGLSHSAVSQQIKALEEELQFDIVDRATRPPTLTDNGFALVALARQMLAMSDEIRTIAKTDGLVGSVTIGVVPSALVGLMPPALAGLRRAHPQLQLQIRSGLSSELAQALRNREIDLAIVTQPRHPPEGLRMAVICQEAMDVIVPSGLSAQSDIEALEHPFIWFNRRSWVGGQIEENLAQRRIFVRPMLEIDSIEAIESLVAHGLGVSITPRRFGVPHTVAGLRRLPFGQPQLTRGLVMLSHESGGRPKLVAVLLGLLRGLTDPA